MNRYAALVGRTGIASRSVHLWVVIRADDSVDVEALYRKGFEVVPPDLSDDEVLVRYGVSVIYTLTDRSSVPN